MVNGIVWKTFAASAIGKYHIDNGIPCQDDFDYRVVGDVFVGVVCDGAGSSAHSEVGAKECARTVVERIAAKLTSDSTSPLDEACSRVHLESVVDLVRTRLQTIADERGFNFHDLSCTLVGCIASTEGGCLFHIGDGFGVAEFSGSKPVLSLPENGEYANETYFVTANDWAARLRITPLAAAQSGRIALMSDGAAPFVVNRERTGLFDPFITPVSKFLSGASQDDGNQGLRDTLADERTYAITGDDKTLLIAILQ